ncbi:MAG: YafY family protein [Eubacteriales bacterium]|nr:YafY family protein [Eubacteriales bacterium]
MKIDRMIGILSVLLQQDRVTAPQLAEKFEVSRRTINRDIEDLCKAGIPVVTMQGMNGGISIMEGYKIDRTLLTSSEMQAILAGLRSLDSVSGTKRYEQLMEKLTAGTERPSAEDQPVLIDLASWYKDSLSTKIGLIHTAIERCQVISFRYFSSKGETVRYVEPYHILYQWSDWYVWGWCRERMDFRLFKLNRMDGVACTKEPFWKRLDSRPDLSAGRIFPANFWVKVRFAPECKWRLIEEYGKGSFSETEDGTLLFSGGFTNKENLISWILAFGDKAELLEPVQLREELGRIGEAIRLTYGKDNRKN